MSNGVVIILIVASVFFCAFEIFSFVSTIVKKKKEKKIAEDDKQAPLDDHD